MWDRLFGSFQAEDEAVTYGLTKDIHTYNLWTIATHEWAALGRDVRRARGLDRWRHLVRGPGWQPVAVVAPAAEPALVESPVS